MSEEVLQRYLSMGSASKVATPTELRGCPKLVEILKRHLRSECESFVAEHKQQGLLYSYSFDGTSALLAHRTTLPNVPGRIVRGGRQGVELLMQGIILRTSNAMDPDKVRHLFAEPRVLSEGKSQWFIFGAATQLFPLPRTLGHEGFLLYHVVADRLQLSSVGRLLQARQKSWHVMRQEQKESSEGEKARVPTVLQLKDLFVSCGCALHDLQNALRWSVDPLLLEGETLSDCRIAVEALRNSSCTLMGLLPAHLSARVCPRMNPALPEEVARQFWSLLGVEAGSLESIVATDPWMQGGLLHVNEDSISHTEEEAPLAGVHRCVLSLLKWRTFTESRFMSMGEASQGLLTLLCVGLSSLVEDAKATPGVSLYYLKGLEKKPPSAQTVLYF